MKFIKSALPMFLALGTISGYSSASSVSVNEDVSPEIVRLTQACDSGDASSCFDLGECYSRERNGVRLDFSKARIYYEKACSMNVAKGCDSLGYLYIMARGVKQDYSQAKTYFEKACDLNNGSGCYHLGSLYNGGYGVKQDYRKANTYYEKACSLNEVGGCDGMGGSYYSGEGVKQDYSKASTYWEKACNLGSDTGCLNLELGLDNSWGKRHVYGLDKKYYENEKACNNSRYRCAKSVNSVGEVCSVSGTK